MRTENIFIYFLSTNTMFSLFHERISKQSLISDFKIILSYCLNNFILMNNCKIIEENKCGKRKT